MTPTRGTRKPVNLLSQEDLRCFSVWEYCFDEELSREEDETWVRPVAATFAPANAWSLQVAADLTFHDGSEYEGLIEVTTASMEDTGALPNDDERGQPNAAVLAEGKMFHISKKGNFCHLQSRAALAQAFARDLSAIFPIRYELRVLVEGENRRRSGVLD